MSFVAFTGAGISTASGIPDYRGPSGLWRQDPENEKLVTYDYYVADPEIRRRSWRMRAASPACQACGGIVKTATCHVRTVARPTRTAPGVRLG